MKKKYEEDRPYLDADIERAVKVEAGHKCSIQHCHEHTYLEIHHIDENRANNSIENLILLCDKHHKMAHAKKIDRKDLKEYKRILNFNSDIFQEKYSYFEFYKSLIDFITKELYLINWSNISDNLTSHNIRQEVIDGYNIVSLRVSKTNFPQVKIDLENSILELNKYFTILIEHYLTYAYPTGEDNIIWRQDRRWKQVWVSQEEYDIKADEEENWTKKAFINHCNLVVALNNFANQVRKEINSTYLDLCDFSVVDSMGQHSGTPFQHFEYILKEYRPIE